MIHVNTLRRKTCHPQYFKRLRSPSEIKNGGGKCIYTRGCVRARTYVRAGHTKHRKGSRAIRPRIGVFFIPPKTSRGHGVLYTNGTDLTNRILIRVAAIRT